MTQGIGVEEIIDIQTEVQSGGTLRAEFGTGLLLTNASSIPAGGSSKCQRFGSLSAVADVFGSTSDTYREAAVWFAADPAPKALYIGRWANADVPSSLQGARLSAAGVAPQVSDFQHSDGSFTVAGENKTLNTSTVASLTALATSLQTTLRTISSLSTATVSYDTVNYRFNVNYGTTANIGGFTATTPATGTDLSSLLRLAVTTDQATSATYFQGSPSEGIGDAFTKCVALATGGAPTALMLYSAASDANRTSMEVFAQGGDYMTARLETSNVALGGADTSSGIYGAWLNQRSHVVPVYSRGAEGAESIPPRPDIGILAALSSQNFDLPQSIITLVPKSMSGVPATIEGVTETALQNLAAHRASVYTTVGGLPSLLGGWTAKDGVWADAQWWLLWLKNEMERTIFEAMRSSKRLSHLQLKDAINGVMAKAVNSGGAKPGGVVSDVIKHDIRRITGNQDFDGVMRSGYLVWIAPPQSQLPADRAARISRFKVWVAPSEAIHSVGGGIILSG